MKRQERTLIFKDVYENNRWGRSWRGLRYYSDSNPALTKPFRDYITEFIAQQRVKQIVDLGCGDFELFQGINIGNAQYLGVDIYPKLIEFDIERYMDENHEFRVLDIVEDDLPAGDLCVITCVLYLLSFDDIFAILGKLDRYHYVLITDGQPDVPEQLRRNYDKATSAYTRSYHNRGLYLELSPFNLNVSVVCQYQIPEGYSISGEIIRTILLENRPNPTHNGQVNP